MAYDHDGDLPEDYAFGQMIEYLCIPEARAQLHKLSERTNLLNHLGHESLANMYAQVLDPWNLQLADLGATIYEVATLPSATGNDIAGTPTYQDPRGMKVAMETAFSLNRYSDTGLRNLAENAANVLDEEARMLAGLVTIVGESSLGPHANPSDIRRVKSGAGVMRTFHITAAMKLGGEF